MLISLAVYSTVLFKTVCFVCLAPHFSAMFQSSCPILFCSLSESFFMVKGAALFLQQGSSQQGQKAHPPHKHAGENHKARHPTKAHRVIHLSYSNCSLDLINPCVRLLVQVRQCRAFVRWVNVLPSLTLQQMFVGEVRRMEAVSLISMFQTYSLGRLVLKSSAR